jgi:hypothetical protein
MLMVPFFGKGVVCSALLTLLGCAGAGHAPNARFTQLRPTTADLPSSALGPVAAESSQYIIRHDILGELGAVSLRVSPQKDTSNQLTWTGEGSAFGSFLGIGESSTFVSQFNALTGLSTKWKINRDIGSAVISDDCEQVQAGIIATHRVHSKKPEDWSTLHAGADTTDPFGFLMRLRIRPPSSPTVVMVLDGRALWKVTVQPAKTVSLDVGGEKTAALRFDLRSDPLDWRGAPSKTRTTQHLVIWLANTTLRTPLALEAASPIGNVHIEAAKTQPVPVAVNP